MNGTSKGPNAFQLARLAVLIAKEQSLDLSTVYTFPARPLPKRQKLKYISATDDFTDSFSFDNIDVTDCIEPDENAVQASEQALELWRAAERYASDHQFKPRQVERLANLALRLPPPPNADKETFQRMYKRVEAAHRLLDGCVSALDDKDFSTLNSEFSKAEDHKLKRKFQALCREDSQFRNRERVSFLKGMRCIAGVNVRGLAKLFKDFASERCIKHKGLSETDAKDVATKLLTNFKRNGVDFKNFRILLDEFPAWRQGKNSRALKLGRRKGGLVAQRKLSRSKKLKKLF
jgi:hypothetical protein